MNKTIENKHLKKIKKNIRDNITLFYNNKKIEKYSQKIKKENELLAYVSNEIMKHGDPFKTITFWNDDEELSFDPKIKSVEDLFWRLHSKYVSQNFSGIPDSKNEYKFPLSVLDNDMKNPINNYCKKMNLDPFLWRNIILAKIIGISKNQALKISNSFIKDFLPKIKIDGEEITIRIHKNTTLGDVKIIWKDVNNLQKDIAKNKKQIYQRKEYKNYKRDKIAYDLKEKGMSYKEIHKELVKLGYNSPGYDYISKMIKKYKDITESF